ncbi:contractile injection system tape measure protein [Poritiphilus flavus]|uniref:Uncharacterized protein n=1 Tax=Poritiphilus flavus TaxID=2697053 RepID=A0A6L9EIH0_9FLAO|nr:contractile injection system tape measure protein [Poritiphilus flavus]NAS14298.1 hypothetical protein [Poritiphilus flavus]
MDRSKRHIINRINLTFDCSSEQLPALQALGLADELQHCLEDIAPFLDERFGQGVTRIPELSLNLDLNADSLYKLRKSLSEQLVTVLLELGTQRDNANSEWVISDKSVSPEMAFFYFLKHGETPWFSLKPEPERVDFSKDRIKSDFIELLTNEAVARERLADQVPLKLLYDILLKTLGEKPVLPLFSFLETIKRESRNYSKRFAAGHRLRQHFLKSFLNYAFSLEVGNDWKDLAASVWPSFSKQIKEECNGNHLLFLEFLQTQLPESLSRKNNKHGVDLSGSENTESNTPKERVFANQGIKAERDDWQAESKDRRQLVYNAGLVLLHPFIKRLFLKVGLLENDQFISTAHQQRALCLMHTLATGSTIFPEEELLLAKVLCHYPVQKPLPRELPISEFELEEINQLLESAVAHWGALKKTSIDGLRINFLQRKGTLEQDGPGITLYVEKHTADILLDQLPWGISIIHFPWLPNVLTVKWR